jgi:HAD superfamily hydrolase (TIGR01509 family)
MFKAIIFDMDGVLVDSVTPTWKSINILLEPEGLHFSDEQIKKYLSGSLRDNMKTWQKEFHLKEYDIMEFSKKAGAITLDLLKNEKPSKALIDLLKEAKKSNIGCAVATSSLRWRAEKILDLLKIKEFFEVIVTAEDVKKHKPDPEVFLEAARRLQVKPEECAVFEDAANGVEAAQKGNMKAIGLVTKYYSSEELKHANLVIKDFREIDIKKLEKLF